MKGLGELRTAARRRVDDPWRAVEHLKSYRADA